MMKCPFCKEKSCVEKTERIEADDDTGSMVKQRRRVCRGCYESFYTYEVYRSQFNAINKLSESFNFKRGKLKSKGQEE